MRLRDFLAMLLLVFGLGMTPAVFTGCEEQPGDDGLGDIEDVSDDEGDPIDDTVDDALN